MGFFKTREPRTDGDHFRQAVERTLSEEAADIGQRVKDLEDQLIKYYDLCNKQDNHIKLLTDENDRFRSEREHYVKVADRAKEIHAHLLANLKVVYRGIKEVLEMPVPKKEDKHHETTVVLDSALKATRGGEDAGSSGTDTGHPDDGLYPRVVN